MSSEFLSEQEQADRVIKLIKKHGMNVLLAIMLALSAYFGYQYFQNKKLIGNAMASNEFQKLSVTKQSLSDASTQGDKTKFLASVDKLVKEHPESIYAQQALLLQAQFQAENNQIKEALASLKKARTLFVKDNGMLAVIDLRTAQLMIANDEGADAVNVLNKISDSAFTASKQELLGDAYFQQKQLDKAKTAYTEAWKVAGERDEMRNILRLKMEQLGIKPKEIDIPQVVYTPKA